MWRKLWQLSMSSPDVVDIFASALAIWLLQIAVKYLTKMPVLRTDQPDPNKKTEAHFECLQVGVDLAFVGLVTSIGVIQSVLKHSGQQPRDAIESFQVPFYLFQFVLIVIAAFFTGIFNSAETTFLRGTLIPFIFGAFSIWTAVSAYILLAK